MAKAADLGLGSLEMSSLAVCLVEGERSLQINGPDQGAGSIAILSGARDRELIAKLGLGKLHSDEFISFQPTDPVRIALLREAKHID